MTEHTTIDITSSAFAARLANLLASTRERSGEGRFAMARESQGRFGYRDLRDFEKGTRQLDEQIIDDLAQLYRCDLGTILPHRLPVVVTGYEVSAGGVHQGYVPEQPDALLQAYLLLVRSLRRQRRTPVVDLRRDDLEVLASYLDEPRESVLHRLATLMNATQRKRAAMTGVLATGAAVIGLAGIAVAVDSPSSTVVDGNSPTTVSVAPTQVTTQATVVTTSPGVQVTTQVTTQATTVTTAPRVIARPGIAQVADTTIGLQETNITIAPETSAVVDVVDPPLPPTTP